MFSVTLVRAGDRTAEVIELVRALTGFGLRDATDLVTSAPKDLVWGVSLVKAEAMKQQLEALGAVVELR
jgi:large subunit ribosomal protein L7/L12